MALAIYVKKTKSEKNFGKIGKKGFLAAAYFLIRHEKQYFITIALIGISSMVFALFPMIVWQFKTLPKLSQKIGNLPIPKTEVLSAQTLAANVSVAREEDGFTYFTTDIRPQGPRPKEYTLSIPKLEIKDAQVLVDSVKFDSNLAQFPGTALPGDIGNTFITGHSALPQFANPKNYRTIFSKLPDLEVGDTIYVQIEGKKMEYVVQYSKVVDPKDLSVLLPITPSARNLTLMTCVPPGTNSKRLVVITSLI
ncbi:class E sortase [Candidatus Curtissbacteria bacterium]|nr:class E sortase [Candidatus Curtissbacteria bacterium]